MALSNEDREEIIKVIRGNGSFVSTALPADIKKYLKDATGGRPYRYLQHFPLYGGFSIVIDMDITAAQEIVLKLGTSSGDIFWKGAFVPEPE